MGKVGHGKNGKWEEWAIKNIFHLLHGQHS